MSWKIFFYYNLMGWIKLLNVAISIAIFCIPFIFDSIDNAWVFLFWVPALMFFENMETERKRLRKYLLKVDTFHE